MALWTLPKPTQALTDVAWTTANTSTVSAVADSTAHTKGAWAELDASTASEWQGFWLMGRSATYTAATDTSSLLDIGIGDAGSEIVVLADVPHGFLNNSYGVLVPLRIPAGVRVALRRQSAVSSNSETFSIVPWTGVGFTGGGEVYSTAVTYGANTSTSQGVTVTADTGNINTFGAWTEIAATTSAPIRAMIVGVQAAADTDTGVSYWRLEVGFGAAGSEVAVDTVAAQTSSSEYVNTAVQLTRQLPTLAQCTAAIPEGARLAARLMTSLSTTTVPSMDAVIIGLR